jgi:hypothetical protein
LKGMHPILGLNFKPQTHILNTITTVKLKSS